MNSINEILSKELQVKPLGPDEKVEFRVINFALIDSRYDGPIRGGSTTIVGQELIFDPFDQKRPRKTIWNITGHKPVAQVAGATEPKFGIEYDYIRFGTGGVKMCTSENNDEYFFLKRSNKNRDNRFRDRKADVKFYEVDEIKELAKQNATFEYRTMASYQLMQTRSTELQAMADRFNSIREFNKGIIGLNSTGDVKNLRANFEMIVQQYPAEFMLASGVADLYIRVLVDKATEDIVILYDDEETKRQWIWQRSTGDKGRKIIVQVPAEEDALKYLIEFLKTEKGSEHLAELKARHAQRYYAVPV